MSVATTHDTIFFSNSKWEQAFTLYPFPSVGEGDETCPVCPSERKSPVSLVHEMALKRKLAVSFEVVEEKGQPHMRMYYTRCTVGNLVTMGEGNGKKVRMPPFTIFE
jgi:Double-stranded RNA binding motif.